MQPVLIRRMIENECEGKSQSSENYFDEVNGMELGLPVLSRVSELSSNPAERACSALAFPRIEWSILPCQCLGPLHFLPS